MRLGEGRGELREAALTWRGEGTLEGELVCYLEPVLAPLRDYRAHPAFSKLMVESRELGEGVQFRRRARGGEGERYLAVLWSESGARFETAGRPPWAGAACGRWSSGWRRTPGGPRAPCWTPASSSVSRWS